jgi:hypothetical protein
MTTIGNTVSKMPAVVANPAFNLLLWIGGVVVFVLILGPLLARLPAMRPMGAFIEERGIEANMYFYTEVEAFSEANLFMDNTMDYLPRMAEWD